MAPRGTDLLDQATPPSTGTVLTAVRDAGVPTSASAALLQEVDRPGDPALPRLLRLGALDLQHVPGLVAVGQAVEGAPGRRLGVQRGGQVGRHAYLPRGGVELDVHVHLLAASDTRAGAMLRAHPDHV